MRWVLRERAARCGMTTSAQVRRRLAAAGLAVSAGKMSGLWSGTPITVRLDDLEVLCRVLACEPSDLLVLESPPPLPPSVPPALSPSVPPAGSTRGGDGADGRRLRRLVPPL
ncbi:helix-turn-helix domain-containing protein [Streptomyces sp. NPDC099088]|uniref:helix-turn-helix domain-containing protein n=1 Tax=Streptomyces sp. NPDC099088 TaxID=3366101 RepID=UPI003827F34B